MSTSDNTRLKRAFCALEGLSVGDAFGDRFFLHPDVAQSLIAQRALPATPWLFSDDTNMALSIVEILGRYGEIKQVELASSFAQHFDLSRGYGPAMVKMFHLMDANESWQSKASKLFGGQGSFGNGGAMRVAPLGAYFADDLDQLVEQARLSAEVTHAHHEGIAGTIAVAVAAAVAHQMGQKRTLPQTGHFLDQILPFVPDSVVREKIRHARNLAPECSVQLAVAALGNGSQVTAQDTVAFALWCATQNMGDFEETMWLTVSALGDRDTTCAIAGGIVAMFTGIEGIPAEWRRSRESLPDWYLDN